MHVHEWQATGGGYDYSRKRYEPSASLALDSEQSSFLSYLACWRERETTGAHAEGNSKVRSRGEMSELEVSFIHNTIKAKVQNGSGLPQRR